MTASDFASSIIQTYSRASDSQGLIVKIYKQFHRLKVVILKETGNCFISNVLSKSTISSMYIHVFCKGFTQIQQMPQLLERPIFTYTPIDEVIECVT